MSAPITISNPVGLTRHTNRNRASRLVQRGRARWLSDTQIEILRDAVRLAVGIHDATPGRAVYPPWPGWEQRLASSRYHA